MTTEPNTYGFAIETTWHALRDAMAMLGSVDKNLTLTESYLMGKVNALTVLLTTLTGIAPERVLTIASEKANTLMAERVDAAAELAKTIL